MTDVKRAFGQAVRAFRLKKGLSQEELAAAAGLDRTYISGLERGVRNPALTTQEKVAKALGTTLRALMLAAEEHR